MATKTPPPEKIVPSLLPMAPVAANNEESATVVVSASETDPVPRFEFFPELDGLTEPPNMQPFGENVVIFGHGVNLDCPNLPNIPNGTNNTAGVAGLGLHGSGSPSE